MPATQSPGGGGGGRTLNPFRPGGISPPGTDRGPAYSTIGPYRRGVWLVELRNGAAAIMDKANLPQYRMGTKYYWLGATPTQAVQRLPWALHQLNLDVSTYPNTTQAISPAFKGHIVGISGDWNAPGAPGPAPFQPPSLTPSTPTYPGAHYDQGPLGAISDTLDFLKFISWLFHPLNILRAVEFLTGMTFIYVGLRELMGIMRRSSATHRTSLVGSITGLFKKTPWGRAASEASARRRGRRAGELQAERDVAYRGARQERARAVGAGRRTTPGSGGTGGTGRGSSDKEREDAIRRGE